MNVANLQEQLKYNVGSLAVMPVYSSSDWPQS